MPRFEVEPANPAQQLGRVVAKKSAVGDDDVIVIKKYANRRLYNTATSSYVTLDHLCEMVKNGREFLVHDAKTGEDITRSVLAQIIFEEEGKGQNLLPINFLRQLIRFYGDSLQSFIPSYLEMSMDSFSRDQTKMRERLANAFGGRGRFEQLEDQVRQNLAMFESAVRMFTPFAPRIPASSRSEKSEPPADAAQTPEPARETELSELKEQIAAMQEQLKALAETKK